MLDSLAYYLLLGSLDGIETEYKKVMNAKREIPVSSCPASVENAMYASGGVGDKLDAEEKFRFGFILKELDEKAKPYEKPKIKKKFPETLQHKRARLGIHGGEWCRVDTECKFWYKGQHYVIDDMEVQYAPEVTEYGDYYMMDKVLASGGKFYDMSLNEIRVMQCGGIVKE